MTGLLAQPAIHRIRPDEGDAWRELRLRALRDAPEAFGSTYVETLARPANYWTARAAAGASGNAAPIFLAHDGAQFVGVAGGFGDTGPGNTPHVISMWVAPEARGGRVAERLVNQVVDWAALAGSTSIGLWVTETNDRARRLYERLGFEATGNRQPLPSNPALAEIEMQRSLEGHIAVRRIRSYETEAWRATRLAALRDAPTAFGPTYEETLARPVIHWSERISDAATSDKLAVFAAVQGKQWVGLAGIGASWGEDDQPDGTRHLGSIWIAPEVRGRQILPRLLDAAYDWAATGGAQRIALHVTETNERAINAYEQYGYHFTGTSQPLRPGSDLKELRMLIELRAPQEFRTADEGD